MRWLLTTIVLIAIIAGGGYFAYEHGYLPWLIQPCSQPITYSLGTFDPKFGITQDQFLDDVNQAAQIWDAAVNKDLYRYSPNGKLKINLVYDYRQEATDKLKSLGLTIDDTQGSYQSLKAKYDSLTAEYKQKKQNLEIEIASYTQQRQSYEQTVNYWNRQGGAPRNVVDQLNQQRNQLNSESGQINQDNQNLNSLVDNINGLANILNRLGAELNLNVATYNSVGTSRGPEFEEGLYKNDSSGREVDIYEFTDQNQLVRVLAHELGHALGLEHNSNPMSIMYYLNQSKNTKPTIDDIAALKQVCKIK